MQRSEIDGRGPEKRGPRGRGTRGQADKELWIRFRRESAVPGVTRARLPPHTPAFFRRERRPWAPGVLPESLRPRSSGTQRSDTRRNDMNRLVLPEKSGFDALGDVEIGEPDDKWNQGEHNSFDLLGSHRLLKAALEHGKGQDCSQNAP